MFPLGFAFFHSTSFCEIQAHRHMDLCFAAFMMIDLPFSYEQRVNQVTYVLTHKNKLEGLELSWPSKLAWPAT